VLLFAVYNFHFEFLRIGTFVPLLVFDHAVDRLYCEATLCGELLHLVDGAVVDGDVDVQVAEDGELLALLDEDFGPLALRVTLLDQVQNGFNVPVSCGHLFQFVCYFIIILKKRTK